MTSSSTKKGGVNDVVAGIRDFVIVVLLMVASAAGGYFYGSHERFAPVEYVPATTPGAVKPAQTTDADKKTDTTAATSEHKK